MSTKAWGIVIIVLAVVIIVLGWFLFTTPAAAPVTSPQATTTNEAILPSSTPSTSTASSSDSTGSPQAAPLDTRVVVTTPQPNATVSHSFEVAGVAPGPWYFEGVFPIQVRDENDNLIGTSQGKAQGEWTTNALVTFTSHITIDASYKGSANLILLKDNPSGLPQNIDEVTIPIVVQ